MICGGNQIKGGEEEGGGGEEEEGLPFSIAYCWDKGKEDTDFWRNDIPNGQVLVVLTAHKPRGSTPIVMNSWEEKLKTSGIEIVYVTLWINLYSVLQIFSVGRSWKVSVLVTLIALVAAVAILVIIHRYQRKMNVNTDMRLMAANEAFMKLGFIVGMTNIPDKNCAVPQLWFVHFDVAPCLRSLTDSLATLETNQESALKRSLEDVGLVVEIAILPTWENQLNDSLEETSLLPETKKRGGKNFMARREFLPLVPDGTPETMAQQLLTVFSSYYVRLLVSGQLPEVPAGQHKTISHKPCLCQFVKTRLLGKEFSRSQERWTFC
ncbi:transmembrane protein 268 isoform X2 [Ahaetulla prasina]|uniref:transmembrane protein 268 isoform X2 n=1 Tax=Ahaetulla prasina TaxID=499056 RepID=UPI002649F5A9|nr:transmembrane protein 268 isoform X2 [Ahaetulla prasina]